MLSLVLAHHRVAATGLNGFAEAGRRYFLEDAVEFAGIGVLARANQNTASALGEALQSRRQSLTEAGDIVKDDDPITVQIGGIHRPGRLHHERELAVLTG